MYCAEKTFQNALVSSTPGGTWPGDANGDEKWRGFSRQADSAVLAVLALAALPEWTMEARLWAQGELQEAAGQDSGL